MGGITVGINRQLDGNRLSMRLNTKQTGHKYNTASIVGSRETNATSTYAAHMYRSFPCVRKAVKSSFLMSFCKADIKVMT